MTTITDLPTATTVNADDTIPIAQGGITKQVRTDVFAAGFIASSSASAAASATSATAAAASATASATSAVASATAQTAAEAARDAAITGSIMSWPTTAAGIGNGIAGVTSIVGGTGGTNGTFALAFSGGTQVVAPAGVFVVAGGAVVSITITASGYYSAGTPTLSFAASTGLTGASATAVMAANANVGEYFSVPGTTNDAAILYRVDAGPTATEVARFPATTAVIANRTRVAALENAFTGTAGTRVVGKATTPAVGTAGSAGTYFFTGRPCVAGSISAISVYASAQTAKIKVYRPSAVGGTAYTLAYEFSLTLAAGLNTFSVATNTLAEYLVQEGDVIGLYVPTNIHYAAVAGVTGYTFFAGDKSDAATFDNMGAVGATELQFSATIAASSSADITKIRAVDSSLARTFSVGELSPAAPASLQYVATGYTYGWDWTFKSGAVLTGVTLSSQAVGVAKLLIMEPYLGGFRTTRSVQIKFAAGVSTLVAGTDFPAGMVVPKGGMIAIKAGTANSLHLNVFNTLSRYRTFYGDATDGIFPSYNWPSGAESLSTVGFLSGAIQVRFDFSETVDPVHMAAPQYIVREKFSAANGPVTMLGDTWTKGAGKMSSGTVGLANGLEWSAGHPHLTDLTCRWKFAFTASGTLVYFYRKPSDQSQGSIVSLDMTSGNIVIYNMFPATGTLGSAYSTTACTLTLTTGRTYSATLAKTYRDWSITFTDTVAGATQTISIDGDSVTAAGFAYGVPGIAVSASSLDLTEFAMWSARKAPKVLLFGDSITEGSGATVIANSWAYLTCENGNGIASPRGGDLAASIVKRIFSGLNAYPSVRYAIILAGTNDTDMTIWQRAIDNAYQLCMTYGVIPVFGTLPPEAADTNPVLVQNPYIRSSGYRYIDFARALTTGGDGTTRDATKFFDALHPNDAGHAAMYARVRFDLPELFD